MRQDGPHEPDSEDNWGADPVKAFEASRRREVKVNEPTVLEMRAHRAMVRKFCNFITKIVRGVGHSLAGHGESIALHCFVVGSVASLR